MSKRREEGAVLITVMVVSAVVLLFGTAISNHLITSESDAVEEELLKARIYWAEVGHLNYMLSRAAGSGLCDGADRNARLQSECDAGGADAEADRIAALEGYLAEIEVGGATPNNYRVWRYPSDDLGASQYFFAIGSIVQDRTGAGVGDGEYQIDLSLVAGQSGNASVLDGAELREPVLRAGFCVTDQNSWTITSGINPGIADEGGDPSDTGDDDQAIIETTCVNTAFPSNAEGRSRIQFVRWAP